MEIAGVLAESRSPQSTTVAFSSPPTAPPPAPESSGATAPYIVLRNHIPIYTNSTPSPENPAPDFISLDDDITDCRTPTPPFKRSRLDTNAESSTRSVETIRFRANCRFKSPMLQLHKEILDFCEFLSPTAEEQVSRNAAVECVSDVIKYIWPHCKVEIFGSFKTGLFLPSSDVDMVILESRCLSPQQGLKALKRVLSMRGVATKMQVLSKARVPIIKFVEKRSGIAFDISFDMDNGPKAAEYIQDAISKWPPLKPLCLILKVFLRQRKLNEVYSGGIGSFALLVMLIAMLRNSLGNSSFAEDNLGVLLVSFFDLYGCKLNTSDVGISCDEGSTFFSKGSKGFLYQNKKLLIAIQDPQAPDKDLGKNSRKYFQIKCSFETAYSTLTNTKLIMSLGHNRSILGTIIGRVKGLMGRKGGLNGDLTFTGILPGAGEPLQKDFGEHDELSCNANLDADDHDEAEPLQDNLVEHDKLSCNGNLDAANPDKEPLVHEKDVIVVSDDDVAKESKKVVKVKKKKMVKVKKIRKVIIIN